MTALITDQGHRQIEKISRHLESLSANFGERSSDFLDTSASFYRSLTRAIGLGGEISADGALGLYVVTDYGMHVGMVFFTDHVWRSALTQSDPTLGHYCTRHERPWSRDSDVCLSMSDGGAPASACIGIEVPVTGTWSLHS